ncbi:hypothetical protein ABZ412_34385 [Nocardia sp. NPDC005746]|uniref:hypothetical protein n=1 Tax=Nocardia sp. NPDC005746 TaxID=3157062 RepID=UPI0033F62667
MLRRNFKRIARAPIAIFDAALMAVMMILVSAYRILLVTGGAYRRWRNRMPAAGRGSPDARVRE